MPLEVDKAKQNKIDKQNKSKMINKLSLAKSNWGGGGGGGGIIHTYDGFGNSCNNEWSWTGYRLRSPFTSVFIYFLHNLPSTSTLSLTTVNEKANHRGKVIHC